MNTLSTEQVEQMLPGFGLVSASQNRADGDVWEHEETGERVLVNTLTGEIAAVAQTATYRTRPVTRRNKPARVKIGNLVIWYRHSRVHFTNFNNKHSVGIPIKRLFKHPIKSALFMRRIWG